ncbi:MAG: hypothetical protein V1929_04400 [bacterium]
MAKFECKLVNEVVCSHITDRPTDRLTTLVRSTHMGGLRQK